MQMSEQAWQYRRGDGIEIVRRGYDSHSEWKLLEITIVRVTGVCLDDLRDSVAFNLVVASNRVGSFSPTSASCGSAWLLSPPVGVARPILRSWLQSFLARVTLPLSLFSLFICYVAAPNHILRAFMMRALWKIK